MDEAAFQNALLLQPGLLRRLERLRQIRRAPLCWLRRLQQARTFTGAVSFIRSIPAENWLDPRNRTIFDFSASDGVVTQPNTPRIKTEIYHVDAERDQYFPGKDLYGFAQTSFDHNFSQGLNLQANFGGGLGYTVIKRANETLDFKASITYIRQEFQAGESVNSMLGSNFVEAFTHKRRTAAFFSAVSDRYASLDPVARLFRLRQRIRFHSRV